MIRRIVSLLLLFYLLGYALFVEIGPTPTLLGMGRACVGDAGGVWLPSLRKGRSDWEQLLSSLSEAD